MWFGTNTWDVETYRNQLEKNSNECLKSLEEKFRKCPFLIEYNLVQ